MLLLLLMIEIPLATNTPNAQRRTSNAERPTPNVFASRRPIEEESPAVVDRRYSY